MFGPEQGLFAPSAQTGAELRTNFNASFLDSLEYLISVCRPHVNVDEKRVGRIVSRIKAGSRETPYLYSLHFQIVEAIQQECLADIERHLDELLSLDQAADRCLIAGLASHDLPWDSEITTAYFADEDGSFFSYVPPGLDETAHLRTKVSAAIEMMERFAPGLAAEMKELLTTVIITRGVARSSAAADQLFESSTALRAFGGMLLNAAYAGSVVEAATVLIHETAHTALFALSPKEGVVLNPESERYSSPLREEPRPLEGIFHQVFVLARMIYGMELLRSANGSSQAECDLASEFIEYNVPRFRDAVATVHHHAQLTDAGHMALAAAENYMETYN